MDENVNHIIEEIKNLIITKFDPEKVILFGSCSKGNMDKNSDIDLFIVKKTNLDFHHRIMEANDVIPHTFPVDIIAYTPEEYEKYKDNKWSFLYRVVREGKVLYERKRVD